MDDISILNPQLVKSLNKNNVIDLIWITSPITLRYRRLSWPQGNGAVVGHAMFTEHDGGEMSPRFPRKLVRDQAGVGPRQGGRRY
jgi:hypothetical protein